MTDRTIEDHKVNSANDRLTISVMDEPGSGGANHRYLVHNFDSITNPSRPGPDVPTSLDILFQNGPINEAGVNGVTHEVLMAIVIDRLRGFQTGPYACRVNAIALTKLEESLMWLQSRTRARMQRGVEGTTEV